MLKWCVNVSTCIHKLLVLTCVCLCVGCGCGKSHITHRIGIHTNTYNNSCAFTKWKGKQNEDEWQPKNRNTQPHEIELFLTNIISLPPHHTTWATRAITDCVMHICLASSYDRCSISNLMASRRSLYVHCTVYSCTHIYMVYLPIKPKHGKLNSKIFIYFRRKPQETLTSDVV